ATSCPSPLRTPASSSTAGVCQRVSWFSRTLPPQRLLPGMHRRHFFQLRLCRDFDEERFIARHRRGDGGTELIWMGDAYAAYPKRFSDANGIHLAAEIDAEIALAVVQPLQHLDPSKAAVVEKDDGDGQ